MVSACFGRGLFFCLLEEFVNRVDCGDGSVAGVGGDVMVLLGSVVAVGWGDESWLHLDELRV